MAKVELKQPIVQAIVDDIQRRSSQSFWLITVDLLLLRIQSCVNS